MSSPMYKQYTAGGAIAAYRIVKPGGSAGQVVQAAAVGDKSTGVCWDSGPASGERVDVCHAGVHLVEAGAAFAAGDPLTSDAQGRAVTAVATNRAVGTALEAAAAAGDLVQMLLGPQTV